MKTIIPILLLLISIFFSCKSNNEITADQVNTILFIDTLNTPDYPYENEYELFKIRSKEERDSLLKVSSDLIFIDPLLPKPKIFGKDENGNRISINEFFDTFEKSYTDSVNCMLEFWVEWNSKLSMTKLKSYKGKKANPDFIINLFKKIEIIQPEFKKGFSFPNRTVMGWKLKLNSKSVPNKAL